MNKSALFPLRINPGLWNDGLYRDWPTDTLQSMYLHEGIETILGSCAGYRNLKVLTCKIADSIFDIPSFLQIDCLRCFTRDSEQFISPEMTETLFPK